MDPVKRAGYFIRMNDLVIQNVVVVPLLWRSNASAVSNRLRGTEISGWDSNFWSLAHWYKEASPGAIAAWRSDHRGSILRSLHECDRTGADARASYGNHFGPRKDEDETRGH